jgi:hypothetical protein
VIDSYRPGVGPALEWTIAVGLTGVEAALALWLLSGWRLASAAATCAALHTFYLIVLGVTLLRGIEVPNCGCFGVFLARPLEPATLLEDLVLIALSAGLFVLARTETTRVRRRV